MERLLITNGLVIDVEPAPTVRANCDVLIEDGQIAEVGPGLAADGARVIDATDRIVLPGFVDAHRHTWQTALRGISADADLGEYLEVVLGQIGPRYGAADVYAGTFAGAREALASGITTLQDFSHVQYSPAHSDAAVAALRSSGIRAVFGYGAPVFGPPLDHDEVRRVYAAHFAGGDDLVTMALAPSGPSYADLDTVRADWAVAKELGLRIFTHVGGGTREIGGGPRLGTADVLRLATLDGAAALGLDDRVGSLRPGKQADLVLLRASDVNLVGGHHDPIGTVVTGAHPGNVDAVLVAGQGVDTSLPAEAAAALQESAGVTS